MTPKQEAQELYDRYCNMNSHCDDAKECALIAVDKLISYSKEWDDSDYWQEVKQEIEKL